MSFRETANPHVVSTSPSNPVQGQVINFTVTLTALPQGGETYSVAPSDGAAFVNLPTSVTATADQLDILFTATTSTTFSGSVTVTVGTPPATASAIVPVSAQG